MNIFEYLLDQFKNGYTFEWIVEVPFVMCRAEAIHPGRGSARSCK
jgi:hypothetical protein